MAARKKAQARKAAARKTATRKSATKGKRGSARRASAAKRTATRSGREPAYPEVEALVELMNRHGLHELAYTVGPDGTKDVWIARTPAGAGGPAAAHLVPAAAAGAHEAPAASTPAEEGLHAFKSPMVGTFYRAPSPEAPAFVSVGDRVDATSTLCIIEAMKVLNEITPDVAGEIVSIEVENGEAVEFGQTLFLIRPS